MSAVLDALEAQHTTDRVMRATENLNGAHASISWRYDLVSSRSFPAQYYAVASCGQGPAAEDLVVIAIECFDQGNSLLVSAGITAGDGLLLAEAECLEIPLPDGALDRDEPASSLEVSRSIQAAFDQMADWLDRQRPVIERALAA